MKIGGVFVIILLGLLVLPVASANIVIEDDFDSKYSVGDLIELEFSMFDSNIVSGFVESYVNCEDNDELIDKRYVFLDNEKKNFTTEFLLEEDGECQFEIEFLGYREISEDFKVSSKIDIDYTINGKDYLPGDEIIIDGIIRKFNHDLYTGVIDFEIDSMIEKAYSVENGNFSIVYIVKEDAEPKDYVLTLSVGEKDRNEDEINSGRINENINVGSIPTSISIDAVESFSPPYNLSFDIELLNQVGEEVENSSIIIKIIDFENNIMFESELGIGNETSFQFPSDSRKGTIYLNAYYGSIFSSRPVYVEENRESEMKFLANNVEIINVGNVVYEGIVKLDLDNGTSEEEVLINVTIGVGESYFHGLEYVGVYNITSGESIFRGITLTGAAIMVEGEFSFKSLFVVILFISFLAFMYIFTRMKKVVKFFKEEKEGAPEIHKKIKSDISRRKMVLKNPIVEQIQPKQDVYMVFLKTKMGVNAYSDLITKYGFKINEVNSNLAYIVFYGIKNKSYDSKVFNLSKTLRRFSEMKDDDLSIVINKGHFEKKISLLKKFAAINRELIDLYVGHTVIGNRLMKKLWVHTKKKEEVVEVLGHKQKIWVV